MTADLLAVDPIKHVVVLLLENHSFDQMLGAMKQVYPDLDGVDPAAPGKNLDDDGVVYKQIPTTERQMLLDPHHEVEHVAVQLADHNSGFVKDFARSFPSSTAQNRQFIMGYFPADFLPALHPLAREFTVCDRWFSSLPGPTWPNRFFALTGTSNGRVNMPEDGQHGLDLPGWFEQDQPTIFDRLSEKGIHWKVYFHDVPQTSVLMHQRRPENAARYFYISRFHEDARALADDFPQFCLIEPDFMGADENDDHPPHDIMKAEKLIADVYNSLRANPDLWQSTLLIVFYDEHGGFYDHVEPPTVVAPDNQQQEYTFDRLGVRVPALLASPWVKSGVEHTVFDHTSVLKYLIDKWALGPLGGRTAAANSIAVALRPSEPIRQNTLERLTLTADQLSPPDPDLEEKAGSMVTAHHLSLALIERYIQIKVVEDLPLFYTGLARLFEAVKSLFEYLLRWVYSENTTLRVSLTEPDKISRESSPLPDDFARFLQHQKQRAIPVLAAMIRNNALPAVVRDHAVRALSSITGRKFHREPDNIAKAAAWLRSKKQ
jgi:phospholipase C